MAWRRCCAISGDARSQRLSIGVPAPLARYLAPKGSVAVDGVSLTINEVESATFGVNIIPHTQAVTTLGRLRWRARESGSRPGRALSRALTRGAGVTSGLALLRRRGRRLTSWLLLPLVLRSLIPFGFMPIADAGRLSIGLCPGEGPMPAGMTLARSQHLHHHPGSHQPPCLFAASATPALASACPAPAGPLADGARCAAPDSVCSVNLPSIRRAQSPRAPPQFA